MRQRDPVLGIILCVGLVFSNTSLAIDILRAAPIVFGLIFAAANAFTTTAICLSIYRDRIA